MHDSFAKISNENKLPVFHLSYTASVVLEPNVIEWQVTVDCFYFLRRHFILLGNDFLREKFSFYDSPNNSFRIIQTRAIGKKN